MQGAIDTTRLAATVDAATTLGEPLLHVEKSLLSVDAPSALSLLFNAENNEEMRAGLDAPRSLFFWHTPTQWIVGLGASLEHRTHARSLEQANLGAATLRWKENQPGLDDLLIVGGFAFDGERHMPGDFWEGYDASHLWVPELLVVQRADRLEAFTATRIDPRTTYESALARVGTARAALQTWLQTEQPPQLPTPATSTRTLAEPAASAWGELVDTAVRFIRDDALDKVVLARAIDHAQEADIAVEEVVSNLLTTYNTCRVFALRPPSTPRAPTFVGATPECLVRLDAGTIYVDALAGTVSSTTPDQVLLESTKDRHEHQLVIDAISESLDGAAELRIPSTPSVDTLSNVKHLRTSITGTLLRRETIFDLAARLHPTPAICGRPRERARAWIHAHERPLGMERGWYTGAIGWSSFAGDGELDVALRCASIDGNNARLFVGAGIVDGSTGKAELEETRLKSQALAKALMPRSEVSHD